MDFQQEYQQKLMSPEQAVKVVKSGDWLDYGQSSCVPHALDKALAARAEELEDINIRGLLVYHPLEIYEANNRVGKQVFTFNSWYMGAVERRQSKTTYVTFIPMRYWEQPSMYRSKEEIERVDVALIEVAPMDKDGNFNLGPSNAALKQMLDRAGHIIVEVNERVPRVASLDNNHIHISRVNAIVESTQELDGSVSKPPTETEIQIAEHVIKLVPNRATVQLGIGGVPNALGSMIAQSDIRDLGVHTELYTNSLMEMTKAGLITGKYKNLNPGKQVFTFAYGSTELYDFLDEHPDMVTASVDYVNDPHIIAEHDNFISINAAVEVDLYGQISAETSGTKQISGTGGQLDFVTGACNSKGGKSIISITSTFTDKQGVAHSRIVPHFPLATTTTTPRHSVQYIATEFGIYNLRAKSLWQRAEGLINIAHPDFRDQLIKDAEAAGIWRPSNKR